MEDYYNPVNRQRLHNSIGRLINGLGSAHELIEVNEWLKYGMGNNNHMNLYKYGENKWEQQMRQMI